MNFNFNDGGRRKSGYKGSTNDCVVRAISIVTERPYQEIYNEINTIGQTEKITKRKRTKSNARTGVFSATVRRYMKQIGWIWVPTMFVGSGCKVHLKSNELPSGRLLVRVSKHYTVVINGILNDTHNCSRNGTRCVYGYFHK